VLTQAGFEMDIATETGTYCLDEISLTDPFLAGSDKAVFDNRKHGGVVAARRGLLDNLREITGTLVKK
jgi:hypothetical protein